jgi:hypothetical protein
MVRVRWATGHVVLVLCCSLGFASGGGCSGHVKTRTEPDADVGGDAGSGGSGGQGGSAGRGGAAGSTGASAGAGGSTTGFGGTAFGGNAGRSVGGASGVGPAGAGGVGGASGTGSGCLRGDCGVESGENACVACAKANCCSELVCCAGDSACADDNGEGELTCVQDCVHAAVADGGVVSTATVSDCASQCARGATIAPATNDILGCLLNGVHPDGRAGDDCFVECFAGD